MIITSAMHTSSIYHENTYNESIKGSKVTSPAKSEMKQTRPKKLYTLLLLLLLLIRWSKYNKIINKIKIIETYVEVAGVHVEVNWDASPHSHTTQSAYVLCVVNGDVKWGCEWEWERMDAANWFAPHGGDARMCTNTTHTLDRIALDGWMNQ